jgi:serine/threonine-protein kinase
MGVVYRAKEFIHGRSEKDPKLQITREVAIKQKAPHVPTERFVAEMKSGILLEGLQGVLKYYNLIEENEEMYIVMEYFPGESLSELLTHTALTVEQAVEIGLETAMTIEAAHRRNVLHRDFKPSNVMKFGSRVRVVDFGLAKAKGQTAEISRSGDIMGTAGYMAPEMASGEKATVRSEIYMWGLTFKKLLTGEDPFERVEDDSMGGERNRNEFVILKDNALGNQRDVWGIARKNGRKIPKALMAIANKCTKLKASERYPLMKNVIDDLHRYLNGFPVQAMQQGIISRMGLAARRHVGKIAILFLLILGGGGGTGWFFWDKFHKIDSLFDKANNALKQENFESAQEALKEIVWLDPNNEKIKSLSDEITSAELNKLMGDADIALDTFEFDKANEFIATIKSRFPNSESISRLSTKSESQRLNLLIRDCKNALAIRDFARAESLVTEAARKDANNQQVLELQAQLTSLRSADSGRKQAVELLTQCQQQTGVLRNEMLDEAGNTRQLDDAGFSSVSAKAEELRTKLDTATALSIHFTTDERDQLGTLKSSHNSLREKLQQALEGRQFFRRGDIRPVMEQALSEADRLSKETTPNWQRIRELCLQVEHFWKIFPEIYTKNIESAQALRTRAESAIQAEKEKQASDLRNLAGSIADLTSQVTQLKADLVSAESKRLELEQKLKEIDTLNTQLTQVKADLATAVSNAQAAQTKLTTVEAELTKKKEDITKLESLIEEFKSERTKATEQLAATKAKWNTMGEHIAKADWAAALVVCDELVASGDPAATIVKNMLENKKEG